MSKIEFLTPEGFRTDGRRKDETRSLRVKMGGVSGSDGSCFLEVGATQVLAYVYGPIQCRQRSKMLHDKALVTCEYSTATFSTMERKKRSKGDRTSSERSLWLQKTFEAAIQRHLYPRSQIDIYVQVFQADGGVVAAAVNAITLALIDAGIPLNEFVTATTIGLINGQVLLDLNYQEESAGGATFVCAVFNRSKRVCLMELDSKVNMKAFDELLASAQLACEHVATVLRANLLEFGSNLMARERRVVKAK